MENGCGVGSDANPGISLFQPGVDEALLPGSVRHS